MLQNNLFLFALIPVGILGLGLMVLFMEPTALRDIGGKSLRPLDILMIALGLGAFAAALLAAIFGLTSLFATYAHLPYPIAFILGLLIPLVLIILISEIRS